MFVVWYIAGYAVFCGILWMDAFLCNEKRDVEIDIFIKTNADIS